jgi:hypothetical protein
MLWKDLSWVKNDAGDWYADLELPDQTWVQVYKTKKGYALFHDEEQYIWDKGSGEPPNIAEWENLHPIEIMCIIHELRNKFGT